MLELGETLEAGVAREMLEETGLVVDVGPVVEVFDRILLDDAGKVRYHFVLVDYLCRSLAAPCRPGRTWKTFNSSIRSISSRCESRRRRGTSSRALWR